MKQYTFRPSTLEVSLYAVPPSRPFIQDRAELKKCALVVIALRMCTIIDLDKIVVLKEGKETELEVVQRVGKG